MATDLLHGAIDLQVLGKTRVVGANLGGTEDFANPSESEYSPSNQHK